MRTVSKVCTMAALSFRESLARKTFITFFGLSTILHILLILALDIDAIDGAMAMVKVMGQDIQQKNLEKLIILVQTSIAGAAFTGGIFLSIFATASLVPTMLEKGAIDLLISKPLSRTQIFLGRYLGAQSIMILNVTYLIGGSWLILSFKTGIWHFPYLYCILMVIGAFAIIYSLMALVGVTSRSPGVTVTAAFTVFFLSTVLVHKDQIYAFLSSKVYDYILSALYHALPKMSELGEINLALVLGKPVESWLPLWSSGIVGLVMLSTATFIFARKDF